MMLTLLMLTSALTFAVEGDEKLSTEDVLTEIENYINENFDDLKTPGLSIGILIGGEKYFYNNGTLDIDNNLKVTQDTNYELCSV